MFTRRAICPKVSRQWGRTARRSVPTLEHSRHTRTARRSVPTWEPRRHTRTARRSVPTSEHDRTRRLIGLHPGFLLLNSPHPSTSEVGRFLRKRRVRRHGPSQTRTIADADRSEIGPYLGSVVSLPGLGALWRLANPIYPVCAGATVPQSQDWDPIQRGLGPHTAAIALLYLPTAASTPIRPRRTRFWSVLGDWIRS